MRFPSACIFCALIASPVCHASVSLVFSEVDKPILSGLRSSDGSQSADLFWGIVVSSTGSSFSALSAASSGTVLENGADFGNGLLFFEVGLNTIDIPSDVTSGEFGDGVAISAEFDPYVFASGTSNPLYPDITPGDAVAIVWFDSGIISGSTLFPGSPYGIITPADVTSPQAAALDLPSDGATEDFTTHFQGDEPIRNANLAFVAVPEPATLSLAGLGLLGFLRRRR